MSIATEISRLQTAKAGLKTAIEGKGVTVSDTATLDAYPALVESIQTGGSGGSDADLIGVIERSVTSVTVPEGCTKICGKVFFNWSTLTSVSIPDSVTSIDSDAFYYCTKLSSIVLPSNLKELYKEVFYNCTSLASVTLPSNLIEIGPYAFQKCTALTEITIPSNVNRVYQYAFASCTGLTTITFKGQPNYEGIASNAFNGCTNLKTINVPWSSGSVSYAPWGATNATINYKYTGA